VAYFLSDNTRTSGEKTTGPTHLKKLRTKKGEQKRLIAGGLKNKSPGELFKRR